MNPWRIAAIAALWFCMLTDADGGWLTNVPQTLRQPDGMILHCYATGDEYYHWLHDEFNYTIIQNPVSGYFVYARMQNGELVPSPFVAGKVNPRNTDLQRGANISGERMRAAKAARKSLAPTIAGVASPTVPRKGEFNNLVVFIRFQDDMEFPDPSSLWVDRFNSSVPDANSMHNYFFEASYGKLSVNSTFYPSAAGATIVSFQDPHPRGYYRPFNQTTNPIGYTSDAGMREDSLLHAALQYIAPLVPVSLSIDGDSDGAVDNICFILRDEQGGHMPGDILWPHALPLGGYASVNRKVLINGKRLAICNIIPESSSYVGMLCHEFFHTLGAPDLYHAYSSAPSNPVGPWDIMDQQNDPPSHMGAFMKMRYGTWLDSIPLITASGTYALHPLTSPTNNAFIIASPHSTTEYFVVEYRKRTGTFESIIPGDGLLVYRINTTQSGNVSGPPDGVYVYRPGDGLNDVYRAHFSSLVGRTAINDTTEPASILSDGSPGGLHISRIGNPDSIITFDVTLNPSSSVTLAGYVRESNSFHNMIKVTLHGLPGNPATDQTGYYSCNLSPGWSGTVTPTLIGYSFDPPSTTYGNLQSSVRTNYTGTLQFVAIYGYVRTESGTPIEGVVMSGFPGTPTTDSTGFYLVRLDFGWEGSVQPTKAGYSFGTVTFSDVREPLEYNSIGTPLTFSISGLVLGPYGPIDGVVMDGLPGDPSTDTNGNYSETVSYGWSGTVTPQKSRYTFHPSSTTYSNVTSNRSRNYQGSPLYVISGFVRTSGGTAIAAVLMSGLPRNPATDSTGYYRDTVIYSWSGTVTPQKTGYTFTPSSTSYSGVMSDQVTSYTGIGPTSVAFLSSDIPDRYYLSQNFPNPFNPSTRVSFGLPVKCTVSIVIYGIGGQLLSSPFREVSLDPGNYSFAWPGMSNNSRPFPSGVYFLRIFADPDGSAGPSFSEVRKLLMVK